MQAFGTTNYIVLAIYIAAMFGIGIFFARRQHTRADFFLAGRRMPWLPVALSMFASLTSATTYLVLPGKAYGGSTAMIVACIASPLIAPLLVLLFYPAYRKLNATTCYEYIGARYGRGARMAVALLFVLARIGWLGAVIYAPALVLNTVTGLPLHWGIPPMGAIATIYTAPGGLGAVLWTDVIQFVILSGGAVWIAISLTGQVEGGVAEIMHLADVTGRLPLSDWAISLTRMSLPMVGLHFILQMTQDYGTDQVTVQRLMAIRDDRGVTKAICFNAVTDFIVIALLLFIGLGLYAYYAGAGDVPPPEINHDAILPHYIMQALPAGISGLMITAIFAAAMSSMDSGIHSLATVVTSDIAAPLRRTPASDAHDILLARLLVVAFGLASTVVAFAVAANGDILESFVKFMSLFSAPVLVLFLLAIAWKRTRFGGWLLATSLSIPATWGIQEAAFSFGEINWSWYYPLSVGICTLLTIAFSLCVPAEDKPQGS